MRPIHLGAMTIAATSVAPVATSASVGTVPAMMPRRATTTIVTAAAMATDQSGRRRRHHKTQSATTASAGEPRAPVVTASASDGSNVDQNATERRLR